MCRKYKQHNVRIAIDDPINKKIEILKKARAFNSLVYLLLKDFFSKNKEDSYNERK